MEEASLQLTETLGVKKIAGNRAFVEKNLKMLRFNEENEEVGSFFTENLKI